KALRAEPPGRDRNGQDPADGVDPAVQRELPQDERVVERSRGELAGRRKHPERDWKVERRPRLSHVGGCEVDGHAMRREVEPGIANREANALAALPNGR